MQASHRQPVLLRQNVSAGPDSSERVAIHLEGVEQTFLPSGERLEHA